jgi:hypothetical protein
MHKFEHFGDGCTFFTHNNTVANVRRAILERVMYREVDGTLVPPPETTVETWAELCGVFRRKLYRTLPAADPKTLEEFLQGYSGDRRYRRYAQAVESLMHTPVEVRDSWVQAFVKAEKTRVKEGKDPCPRLIQPRDPRYNAAVGRWLRHLEKPLYKAIEKATRHERVKAVVAKGRNAEATASLLRDCWETMLDPVVISLDASRFDQHVSVPALKFEHGVYKQFYRRHDTRELTKLLSWQLATRGRARCVDGTVRYDSTGGRMSGDMNTSTGNCLLMTCMMWSWTNCSTERGVHVVDNGDDVLVFLEREDVVRFETGLVEFFRRLGFTICVESKADVFERIEFCQTQPVWLGDRWVMVRDPRICMAKDLTTLIDVRHPRNAAKYLRSVGDCGLSLTGGCPVLQSFYVALRRCGSDGYNMRDNQMEGGFYKLAEGMSRKETPISTASRVSFWLAFGISPHDQHLIEQRHRHWVPGTSFKERDCPPPTIPFYTPHSEY